MRRFFIRRSAALLAFALWLPLAGTGIPVVALAAPMTMPQSLPAQPGKSAQALQTLLNDLAGQRAQVIEIQRGLVARPALNPEHGGKGEEERVAWIEARLRDKGFTNVLRLESPDDRVPSKVRPNLIVRFPEKIGPGPTLWLLAQLDHSPPDNAVLWEGQPFALRVEGDTLHGMGVEENNQALTICLLLLDHLKQQGTATPLQLGVIFTAGEQISHTRGLRYVMEKTPELFASGDLFVLFDYGDERGGVIEVAEKRYCWLKITVRGKETFAGHAYEGRNPITAGAAFINSLSSLPKEFPETDDLFSYPRNLFTPTKVESSNMSINYVPELFEFHLDMRILPNGDLDVIKAALRRMADEVEKTNHVSISLEEVSSSPIGPPTKADAPVVLALQRAIKNRLGIEAVINGRDGVTMATELRSKGLSAVCWSIHRRKPGVETDNASINAHLLQAQVLAAMLFDDGAIKTGTGEGK